MELTQSELESKGQLRVPGTGELYTLEEVEERRAKHNRHKDDAYFTPEWCANIGISVLRSCLGYTQSAPRVLEPAAGEGVLYNVAEKHHMSNFRWTLRDINQHACDLQDKIEVRDFLAGPVEYGFDAVITNPPYNLALRFIERSILMCDVVVMLLRLNFLGSQKRHDFFKRHMPDVHVLSKRPSFTSGGTDSTEYAWYAWWPGASGKLFLPDCS